MVTESTALHRESVGAGPPIVLAHGFSGSARNWRPQVRALRDRHRVVTYDLRGHARSPAPHDAEALYTLDAFVEDVDRLLDEVFPSEYMPGEAPSAADETTMRLPIGE